MSFEDPRQSERIKCSDQLLHTTSTDQKKNEHVVQSVLTKDPADFRPNFHSLWILVVSHNDTKPQHWRYTRKSSVIARIAQQPEACWCPPCYCCLPMSLLVARTSFPGLPVRTCKRPGRWVSKRRWNGLCGENVKSSESSFWRQNCTKKSVPTFLKCVKNVWVHPSDFSRTWERGWVCGLAASTFPLAIKWKKV